MRSPQSLAARSLELHRRVAEKIRQPPELFNKAFENIARWRVTTSASTMPYLDEWQHILEQGMEVALAKAVEDSEHAACLRRPTPFSGILSNEEPLCGPARMGLLGAGATSHAGPGRRRGGVGRHSFPLAAARLNCWLAWNGGHR